MRAGESGGDGPTMRYVAFDVETPNRASDRMSAIGISVIEDGRIVDGRYTLINPQTHFDYFNVRLTGIDEHAVLDAPTFPEAWDEFAPIMSDAVLVAHNATFDLRVLKACLHGYGITWSDSVDYLCTVQMGRRLLPGMRHRLNDLCDHFGIFLLHHHAASDAHACAEIFLRYLELGAEPGAHLRTFSLI